MFLETRALPFQTFGFDPRFSGTPAPVLDGVPVLPGAEGEDILFRTTDNGDELSALLSCRHVLTYAVGRV